MRSALAAGLGLALASTAGAQSAGVFGIRGAIIAMQDRGLISKREQINPLQPSGGDQLPPREGRLPTPGPDNRSQFEIVRAGSMRALGGRRFEATKGVHLLHRGYDILADRVVYDEDNDLATAYGHVLIIGADAVIRGAEVQVNFRNETFIARDTDSDLRPSLVQGNLLDDLYTRGKTVYGNRREIFGENSWLTTCNLERPHYNVEAERTDIRPGRRAILRKVRIRLFGRTVLKLPFLSVPLDQRSYRYLPVVGFTHDEGYFAKFRFGIPLRGENSFDARLDYYTKLGLGIGGDYQYRNQSLGGTLSVFAITGAAKTLEISSQHRQNFSFGNLTLDSSYQRHNYLNAPQSSLMSNRVSLLVPQGRSSTRFSFYRTSNDSPNYNSVQQNLSVTDARFLGKDLRTNLDLNWIRSSSTFGSTSGSLRQQLDVRFRGEEDLKRATAQIEYQRTVPIGEGTNFFGASERTPLVTLLTDSRRLIGSKFDARFPFRSELSWGEFGDRSGRISRGNFDFTFNKPDLAQRRLRFDYNGRFRQGVYSDDTAQYVLNLGTNLTYELGRDTAFNLRYNYLRPYGFSPLQLDRTGRTNQFSSDLSVRPFRSLLLGAQTGYDILAIQQHQETPWQNVGVRAEFRPADYFQLRALSVYDTFQKSWSSVRLDLAYRPGATYVSAGARYDGIRKTWSAANLFVDGLKWGRLKTSALLAYNGYLKKFEARHFQFTYDLHCAEAILTIIDNPLGFRAGRQISLFIRLKALPFDTPFGIGQRGQPIGTGTGRDF